MKYVRLFGKYAWNKQWTVNLKSFEIQISLLTDEDFGIWTVNLKSFEIKLISKHNYHITRWTVNLKSFEI